MCACVCFFKIFSIGHRFICKQGPFISSFPVCKPFISFSCLIALARALSIMLSKSGEKPDLTTNNSHGVFHNLPLSTFCIWGIFSGYSSFISGVRICVYLYFLLSLTRGLSLLFIFSKNQLLVSLIFSSSSFQFYWFLLKFLFFFFKKISFLMLMLD